MVVSKAAGGRSATGDTTTRMYEYIYVATVAYRSPNGCSFHPTERSRLIEN